MFEHGKNYVCARSVPTLEQATPSCDFKSGQIILQQPIAREQMEKLLATGKTDLLDGFVSNRTKRKFKARLVWDEKEGKVTFEFEPRAAKAPAAKAPAAKAPAAKKVAGKTASRKTVKS